MGLLSVYKGEGPVSVMHIHCFVMYSQSLIAGTEVG